MEVALETFFGTGIGYDGGTMMNQEQYVKAVLKKLKCSGQKKKEIRREMEADIAAALEGGETWDEVRSRMGEAAAVASEFNDNFSKEELRAAKRRKGLAVAGIVAAVLIALLAVGFFIIPKSYPIDQRGNYSEEAVTERAKTIIDCFSEEDYEALQDMCATEKMAEVMTEENLSATKSIFGDDWGSLVSYGNAYTAEIVQMGTSMAVVQINATYENTAITYTISLDRDLKLCGFYMK